MVELQHRRFLIYFVIYVFVGGQTAKATFKNGSSSAAAASARTPRVSGRIVRLVARSSNPNAFRCGSEGFHPDPQDCEAFFRCVDAGNSKFTTFRFQCGPGTVYDPDTNVCNHPANTKRPECGGLHKPTPTSAPANPPPAPPSIQGSYENEVDYGADSGQAQPPPSPITTKKPLTTRRPNNYYEQPTTSNNYYSQQTTSNHHYNQQPSGNNYYGSESIPKQETTTRQTTTTIRPTSTTSKPPQTTSTARPNTVAPSPTSNVKCTSDGFIGDSQNCRKFYRCVGNGRGGYIRYEFSCSESTVWDQDIHGCNHPWAVKENTCGKDSSGQMDDLDSTDKNKPSQNTEGGYQTYPPKPQPTKKTTTTRITTQANYGSWASQSQNQINYGESEEINENQYNYDRPQNKPTYGSPSNQDNNEWQEQNYRPPQYTTTTTRRTTTQVQSTHEINKPNPDDKCTESGFIGDSKDCKKFYRCVDNGMGSYTRYEFSCGEGTVWDQEIQGCNHAWAVKNCGGNKKPESSTAQVTTQTTNEVSTIPTTTHRSTSTTARKTTKYSTTRRPTYWTSESYEEDITTPRASGNDQCSTDGFIGDSKDCKKFYRCVGNGRGGFIRYEFSCGQGTVWDPEIQSCNHEWAVKSCRGIQSTTTLTETTEGSYYQPDIQTTTKKATQKTTKKPLKQPTPDYFTTAVYEEDLTQKPSGLNDQCTNEGFIGDPNDCKIFYRCVGNGRGGYTRYEFACGEGTVWDPEIESCNHEWAVKSCGGPSQVNEPTQKPNPSPKPQTTSKYTTDETHYTTRPSVTQTTKPQTSKPGKTCSQEGFVGDEKDCKKFYRCVDNGKGGYTQFEFSCGEGTVWDQEIEGCNHEWAVKGCGSGVKPRPERTTTEEVSYHPQHPTSRPQTTGSSIQETTWASVIISTTPRLQTKPPSDDGTCQGEGFYPNKNDCKKFHRCVDNGQRGYTKYEFSCGEGTLWDQEIQGCNHEWAVKKCGGSYESQTQDSQTESQKPQTTSRPETQATTILQSTNKPTYEPQPKPSQPSSDGRCTSEGFYADERDCKKFYRCVDNGRGGYTKYEFSCGEGTLWDQEIQGCNHEWAVKNCGAHLESTQTEGSRPMSTSIRPVTESTYNPPQYETTSNIPQSQIPPQPSKSCQMEGFYGVPQDCKKFYRCVDNGRGGLTKYDFSCGEGTIWDQEITGCNHPWAVSKPSCGGEINTQTTEQHEPKPPPVHTTERAPIQTSSRPQSTTGASEPTYSSSPEPCDNKTETQPANFTCPHEGFYAHPTNCKKFYRCVDWDGNGQRYSIYHFDCGDGTIWDPQLDTCNYEESVYPPRDCGGRQTAESTTSKPTTQQTTELTTEATTQMTTQEPTTQTEQMTTSQPSSTTTRKTTTTQKSTTTKKASTSTQQATTTMQASTSTQPTTETTTEVSTTTEAATTTAQTTQVTTEQSTTEGSNEATTQSTTETQTQSTMEQQTEAMTQQQTQNTIDQSTEGTTETSTQTTTEQSAESTTSASKKDCPETEDDQYLFVCPTGFRRHPKYCNLFYQCTNSPNNHDMKVVTFNCPNDTIYDEAKTQCLPEDETDQKCDGEIAETRRFRRFDDNSLPPISFLSSKPLCPSEGYFSFDTEDRCSPAFLKCKQSYPANRMRAFVYQCPEGYVYWFVSRRCERASRIKGCTGYEKSWYRRWDVPMETMNVAL